MKNKEALIYEAVLHLVNQHKNPYKITVSEIADACGIGKGTVYEYFNSKEDIFMQTFDYFVKQVIQDIDSIEDDDFKTMFCKFYGQLENMRMKSNASYYTALFGDSNFVLSQEKTLILNGIVDSLKTSLESFIRRLITQGVKEGILRKDYDDVNLFFGSVGIIASVFIARSPLSINQELKESLNAESCYRSFLKLMN